MKTKVFKNIILTALFVFILSGCQKDFLDTTPEGKIPMDEFYKTDQQAEGALMAVYDIFQSLNARPWSSMWMLKTLLSDEVYTGGGGRGDQPDYEEINEFRFGASNPVISWLFQFSYQGIYRANLVIQNVKPDDAVKKRIIAEAKTLRAMYYFDLVTLWGKVPLVTKPASSPSEYNQPRAEVSDIWAQIDKDLEEAIPDLPLKSEEEYPARVSKGFAEAFLGKSLLYQKKYAEAAKEFQLVIDSQQYGLIPNYADRLRINNEFGKESLFEISYTKDEKYNWDNFYWSPDGRIEESNIHWELCGPRGDGWFEGGSTGLLAGWGFGYPDSTIYEAFIQAGDTVRRKASIMTEAELKSFGGKIRNADQNNSLPWSCVGLIRLKYASYASETDTTATPELNYGTNLRIMEYDDVLLMAAEAYNRSGQDDKALPLINQVRKRALLPDLNLSGDALFEAIKNERRLELAFEGVRYQDLIRWGDAEKVLANQGKEIPRGDGTYLSVPDAGFKSYNVLLPIPEQEIMVNPLCTQNPGY
ncbi:RagB/SusD family nutrient uptake outer membrane protein [Candidatus Sulfidibacterium hydrothermale]|uniref:RagB/SusD family nutrient uptake outer membrane protein n=1 Tax=Candidatus Sulfidibacterium hydrothermale TaxID=2875962 RepID=UPI001F0A369F|nr:RagB/SusD family nutrient uptake outer membrane protein [Candidatus Sulfidibacterium hydrothermale]UBM62518.1 RagB/SusD family nutrient uptake outer membrane protein [Candidatus Sulfidibacterium hydrothermale]